MEVVRTVRGKGRNRLTAAACLLAAAVLVVLCWAGMYALQRMNTGMDGTQVVTGWQYLNMESADELVQGQEGIVVHSLAQITRYAGAPYLQLKTELPPQDTATNLILRNHHNQIKVYVEKQLQLDTMDRESVLSASADAVLPLAPSKHARTVEIILRTEFVPHVEVLLSKEVDSAATAMDQFLLALLIAAAMVSAVNLFLGIARRRGVMVLSGLCGIFLSAGIYLSGVLNSASPAWLRAGVILLMGGGLLSCYRLIYAAQLEEQAWSFLMNAGVLYAAIVCTCRYEQLFLPLARCFGIYYLFTFLLLAVPLLKQYRPLNFRHGYVLLAADLFEILCFILFWSGFLFGFGMDMGPVLLAGVLVQAGVFCLYPNRSMTLPESEQESGQMEMKFRPAGLGTFDVVLDLFLQSKENRRHSRNVSLYTYEISRKYGMDRESAAKTAQMAFLHDIGKLKVPYSVTNKQKALTEEEFAVMKQHTRFGSQILGSSDSPFLQEAATVALEHHERYDGAGYEKLAGQEIDQSARITCIADVFDAVTTPRPYKRAWSFEEGFSYIVQHSGSLFDPACVEAFTACRAQIQEIYAQTRDE